MKSTTTNAKQPNQALMIGQTKKKDKCRTTEWKYRLS